MKCVRAGSLLNDVFAADLFLALIIRKDLDPDILSRHPVGPRQLRNHPDFSFFPRERPTKPLLGSHFRRMIRRAKNVQRRDVGIYRARSIEMSDRPFFGLWRV